ncbi:hypothetical protein BHM03_00058136 [Ensete ventricosum]|nr:hypothetical protein BHM03_00058136 [Ensete ventricosum]
MYRTEQDCPLPGGTTVDFGHWQPIEGEIDRRRSIEGEIDRRWSIEEEKGKKKKRRRNNTAPSSPARRRHPPIAHGRFSKIEVTLSLSLF